VPYWASSHAAVNKAKLHHERMHGFESNEAGAEQPRGIVISVDIVPALDRDGIPIPTRLAPSRLDDDDDSYLRPETSCKGMGTC